MFVVGEWHKVAETQRQIIFSVFFSFTEVRSKMLQRERMKAHPLDESMHLYKRLCPTVDRYVSRSVSQLSVGL